jgi:hypothetical protein
MRSPQEQAALRKFRNIPRHVKSAAGFASLLGIVILIRFLAVAYTGRFTFGKATFYGLLWFGLFLSCGMALFDRKRWGYISVAVFAALPVLNLLATSVHLLRFTLEGKTSNTPETYVSVVSVCQLVVTCVLFRHLLASETRAYVWKTPTGENPTGQELIRDDQE